jgi:CBS domain-containing protein
MRAHQIMTRDVITATPDTSIVEAATMMLQHHVSGLPVVDADKKLVGIVSEGDFLRRAEIGTGASVRDGCSSLPAPAAPAPILSTSRAARSAKS